MSHSVSFLPWESREKRGICFLETLNVTIGYNMTSVNRENLLVLANLILNKKNKKISRYANYFPVIPRPASYLNKRT